MKTAGYSNTPLIKKLGLKESFRFYIANPPNNYFKLLGNVPPAAKQIKRLGKHLDFIHFFTKSASELKATLPKLQKAITPAGIIWVSWPKKASKVETDITEDVIRNLALNIGLVDIKVCAVDEIWSGLKLVIPVAKRKK